MFRSGCDPVHQQNIHIGYHPTDGAGCAGVRVSGWWRKAEGAHAGKPLKQARPRPGQARRTLDARDAAETAPGAAWRQSGCFLLRPVPSFFDEV